MSMQSIKDPEIFDMYRCMTLGVQVQLRVGSPKKPHGHGLVETANMSDDGYSTVYFAREIVMCLSSKCWRYTSKVFLLNTCNSFVE